MTLKRLFTAALLSALLLSACAPENLDITPTATGTNTPEPTATRDATATAAARIENDATRTTIGSTVVAMVNTAVVETLAAGGAAPAATATPEPEAAPTEEAAAAEAPTDPQGRLDFILSNIPGTINAGAIQWRKGSDPVQYQEQDGGVTGRIGLTEPGGGVSELTFGVFDTPEAANAFWEAIRGRLRTLENAETRDNYPQPNAFGSGTYGSDAIFVVDNLFIRVSVPQFSSTSGNPLFGYSRELFRIIDGILGTSYSG